MTDKASRQHIRRKRGLQFAITNEEHYRTKLLRVELEVLSQALSVAEILPQRILKRKFLSEMGHRPLRRVFVAKNPTAIVLSFDNEDAVAGHEHMIDLRGAIARRHNHVMESMIDLLIQMVPQSKLGDLFAQPAFEEGSEHLCLSR